MKSAHGKFRKGTGVSDRFSRSHELPAGIREEIRRGRAGTRYVWIVAGSSVEHRSLEAALAERGSR